MKGDTTLSGSDAEHLGMFGQHSRRARIRRRLSQVEIAERIGVHRLTYRALESGTPSVSLATLQRAMAVLGYPDRISGSSKQTPSARGDLEDITGTEGIKSAERCGGFLREARRRQAR